MSNSIRHPSRIRPIGRETSPRAGLRLSLGTAATFLGSVLFALAATADAQSDARSGKTPPPPGFVETVDVRVVELEAVVEHKGKRVEGLTADDFQLWVDGKATPIDFFSEIRSGTLAATDATTDSTAGSKAGTGSLPIQPSPKLSELTKSSVVPNYFLVFIDDYFSLPTYRNQVISNLRKQLQVLRPEDRMAIVAYDGRVVEMLSSWSADRSHLERALRRASDRPAYGLQRRSEWQQALSRMQYRGQRAPGSSFTSIGFSGSGSGSAGRFTGGGPTLVIESDIATKVSRVAEAAASSLRAFAGPSGRRMLLLLSGGLPSLGGFGLPVDYNGLFSTLAPLAASQDARRLFSPVVEAANLLGFTIYPVDLARLGSAYGTAEARSPREADLIRRSERDSEYLVQDSLYFLAEETGGIPLLKGARRHALRKIADDARSYYSIGFSPSWQANDRPREIRLRTKTKGHKVRARRGYADLSRSSLMSFRVESAHQFDVPLPRAADLDVEFGTPSDAGIGKVHVPLKVRIPLEGIALLPTRNGLTASLELRVAATDDRGHRADLGVIPVELSFADAGEVGREMIWKTTLKLRKRNHRLLFALYDPIGDALRARRVELEL